MAVRSNPLVSIVIPVYNGSNYLREAITSALKQTCHDIEVIVVNDGSDDAGATEAIAKSFGDGIRYFSKSNGGVASALNFAISNMRGEYLSWLSHDDWYREDKIERQLGAIKNNPDPTVLVFSDYDIFQQETGFLSSLCLSAIYPVDWVTNSVFPALVGVCNFCTLLVHKSHFNRVGLFCEALKTSQDLDMIFRLFRGKRTLYIPEPLVTIRTHREAGTNTISCFNDEFEALFCNFISALSVQEVAEMFPSPGAFYHKMACLLASLNRWDKTKWVFDYMQTLNPETGAEKKRIHFQTKLNRLIGGDKGALFIFGAGMYGMRLGMALMDRSISVAGFIDNNPQKWGTTFLGLPCFSLEDPVVKKQVQSDAYLIIVALREPASVLRQLEHMGFARVVTVQLLDALLLKVPPAEKQREGANGGHPCCLCKS